MRNHSVPAECGDSCSVVEVGHARFVHDRLLHIVLDVLDEDLRSTRSDQVFLMRVELNGGHWDAIVDARCRHAAAAHLEVISAALNDLAGVPQGDGTIAHTTSDDAVLVLKVSPVNGRELGG